MNYVKLCAIASVVLLATTATSAQTYTKGHEDKKGEVNLAELSEYLKAHPFPLVRKEVMLEEEEEDERSDRFKYRPEPDPSEVHYMKKSAAREIDNSGWSLATVSNDPTDTFQSIQTNGTAIPPDTHGAVDSNYCVTAINTVVRVQRRAAPHGSVFSANLDAFWATVLPSGTSSFDPRIHYDPYYNRWIIVTFAVSGSKTKSTVMIGVSKTSNPAGGWYLFQFATDATDKAWLDYPNVGFNSKWVTVTGNFFKNSSGGQTGAVAYVFDYSLLRSGTSATYTKISKSSSFTLCPALMYDSGNPSMYVVESYDGSTGKIRLWKITGGVSSPTLASIGYPASTTTWRGSYSGGDFGPQSSIPDKIDCGDDRITNLTYRNGKLWCSHNVFIPYSSVNRVSAMWWQLDTLANPIQNGLVDDPTGQNFYVYPAMAVNQNNDAIIGFSNLSTNSHPNAGYALRIHTDANNVLRSPFIYRHGKSSYIQKFSGTKNRWGDYSASAIDPVNMNDFYTIQETTPTTPNYWDTWWARVNVCEAVASFHVVAHNTNINVNDTFTFNGSAPSGTTYAWDFGSGATPATSTSAGPIAVKWSAGSTKTVTLTVTYGTCSTTYTDTIHVQNYGAVASIAEQIQSVSVSPNPASGNFELVFAAPVSGEVTLKMMDVQGREVFFRTYTVNTQIPVNTPSNLPSGIYLLNVFTDGSLVTRKVTIDR